MGFLVCALMKHTNLVDIGRSSPWRVQDTTQSGPATHTPPQDAEGSVREPLSSLFVLPILLPMARDFITWFDRPQSVLGIECELCQRRERFEVEALKRQHGGDVK